MKIYVLFLLLVPLIASTQVDTAFLLQLKSLDTANVLRFDTAEVINDRLTQKIHQLFSERSGFGLTDIIQVKLMEEKEKDQKHSAAFYDKLTEEMKTGHTARLLSNYLVNLYRKNYNEEEIDQLIKFYRTSAGKKMDQSYLLLLVQSVKGAEQLMKIAAQKLEQ